MQPGRLTVPPRPPSEWADSPRLAPFSLRGPALPAIGHPLALTVWLKADQVELTILHRPEADGALRTTSYRFGTSREGLEPTGAYAAVPA